MAEEILHNRLARWIVYLLAIYLAGIGLLVGLVGPWIGAVGWLPVGLLALLAIIMVWISVLFPLSVEFADNSVILRLILGTRRITSADVKDIAYIAEKWHFESRPKEEQGFTLEINRPDGSRIRIVCDGPISYRMMERFPGRILLKERGRTVDQLPAGPGSR